MSRVSLRSILLIGNSRPEKSRRLVLPEACGPINRYHGKSLRQRSLRPRYRLDVFRVFSASLKRAFNSFCSSSISSSRRMRSWPSSLSSSAFLRIPLRQLTKTMVRPQIRNSTAMVSKREVELSQNL
ncbi:hypothetical protein D3C78_1578170 [compost metagenome]